jgi:CDP-glycerol glycerophosphotransferase (TagB/SpsB family)
LRNGRIDGAAQDNIVPLSTPDLDYLDEWLGRSNVTLLVKPHPGALRQEAELHNIQVISDDWLAAHNLTNYEMLAGIDALVTDASSVWVDFLLLQRPIIYAFPDLNEYQESRGLNLEPYQAWIPGPLVSDAESLIKYLSKVADDEDEFAPERAIALERFHKYVDAGSTTRLLDALAM